MYINSQSEGSGEHLMQLIQIGFSVMNRLLLLRTNDQLSPVEVALSSQPAGYQNQHIVAVIAGKRFWYQASCCNSTFNQTYSKHFVIFIHLCFLISTVKPVKEVQTRQSEKLALFTQKVIYSNKSSQVSWTLAISHGMTFITGWPEASICFN